VRIASTRIELEQAFELLADCPEGREHDGRGEGRYGFTPYHVLPETVTLVAGRDGRVHATMSLVPDTSLLGLPMEGLHGPEVAALRREGRRLAELTGLADSGLTLGEFVQVLAAFIKIAMHYHLRQGGDSWVIAAGPRRRDFYLKVLGFGPLGRRRRDPSAQGRPSEALLLDVPAMQAKAPMMHERVFREPLPEPVVQPPPWSVESVRHFGWNSTQADGRLVEALLLDIEHLGSPPRWRES
jgi:hypothetical protein